MFSFSLVAQSCLTLRSHGPQHARPPCPPPAPGAYSDSTSIELVRPSNHFISCHPFLLLPSVFPGIRVFSDESALHIRWPKYWSFSFSISPPNEYSRLISFRMDLLDLLAVQGTLKVFSNTTVQKHQFFSSQPSSQSSSHMTSYMTTGKTVALTSRPLRPTNRTVMITFISLLTLNWLQDFPGGLVVKNLPANTGD